MKITEIISSPELNEGLGSMAWNAGAKLLGVGAGSSKEAIAKLGAKWAEEIATHGKPVTTASEIVGDKFAKDPAVIQAAGKEAATIRSGAAASTNKAGVMQSLAKGASYVEKTAGLAATLTKLGISAAAVIQYNKRMDAWQKDLDKEDITPDQFELARRKELSVMIGQIALSFMAFGAAKSLASIVGFIPGLKTALGTYGMYKAADYLMTDEGSKNLATVFVNQFYDVTPVLGGVASEALDKIKSAASGKSTGPSGGADNSGDKNTGGPAAAPAGTTTAPAYQAQAAKVIPGTNISTKNTGPNSFDIGYSDDLK